MTSVNYGSNFDPVRFVSGIIDAVLANKSVCPRAPELLVESPEELGTGFAGEDALGCFLRLLGMPAIRDDSRIAQKPDQIRPSLLDQDGTLNYFKKTELGAVFASGLATIDERAAIAGAKQTPENYADMIEEPLSPSASVVQTGRKPLLVPPVVDAAIPIFPLSKRTAPLFNDGDAITPDGKRRLSRSFIEHVVYMRTKVFSGDQSDLVNQISELIEKATNNEELAQKLPRQFTLIEKAVVEKILQAMIDCSSKYVAAVASAKKLSAEVAFTIAPIENPEQRSITPLSSDPKIGVTTTVGAKIAKINQALAVQQRLLITLPTEAVNRSDKIRRIEDEIRVTNVKPDVFVSSFVDLLSFERESLERELESAKNEEREKIMQLEKVKRDLIFYTGEFTGLSVFDALAIFYALFTIDIKFVLGLINNDGKNRLKKDKFFKTNQATDGVETDSSATNLIDSTATPEESLKQLSDQIRVAFQLIEFFSSEAKTRN